MKYILKAVKDFLNKIKRFIQTMEQVNPIYAAIFWTMLGFIGGWAYCSALFKFLLP